MSQTHVLLTTMCAVAIAGAAESCERNAPSSTPHRAASADSNASAVPPGASVQPRNGSDYARVMAWKDAPATCREEPEASLPRDDAARAVTQFLRWAALMIDPASDEFNTNAPFLRVLQRAAKRGEQVFLVVPAEQEVALKGTPQLGTRSEAVPVGIAKQRHVYFVDVFLDGTRADSPGALATLGRLRTSMMLGDQRASRFGVVAELCILPSPTGIPDVYVHVITQY